MLDFIAALFGVSNIAALGALLAALVAAIFGIFFRGRQSAASKQRERDNARAAQIETAADRARAADDAGHVGNPIDRLRQRGAVRD